MKKNTINSLLVILLLMLVAFAILERTGRTDLIHSPFRKNVSTDTSDNFYSPPTDLEKQAGDDKKESIANEKSVPDSAETSNIANVVIVDAGQYDSTIEVRAFASNVIEDGECMYIFSKSGSKSLTKSMPAKGDASSTPCMSLYIERSLFDNSGTWNLEVKFKSPNYAGSSTTVLEIK